MGLLVAGDEALCNLHATFEGLCFCELRLPPLVRREEGGGDKKRDGGGEGGRERKGNEKAKSLF